VLRRGDTLPADALEGPIVVCTRNDVLDDVVSSIPEDRRSDLVFLQNGILEPWLIDKGLERSCTQMLAYFAVSKLGEEPVDGKTEMNPEGLTSIYGKHADAVAERLHASGMSCKVLGKADFKVQMYEKLIWICAFMIVGATHGGCTVGDVCEHHRKEVGGIIRELKSAVEEDDRATKFPDQLEERLVAYAKSVAHFPTAMKEFEWRNGFFYDITQKETKYGRPDPCPLHTKLLFDLAR